MERAGNRYGKMEGQSPQRAVAPTEEEGSSAHFWNPKMFTTIRVYENKCIRIL
jgi:hypothetical protein